MKGASRSSGTITRIEDDVQRAQYLLRVAYGGSGAEAAKAVYAQLDAAQTTLDRHAAALDADHAATLEQIRAVLGEYRSAIESLEAATVAIAKARRDDRPAEGDRPHQRLALSVPARPARCGEQRRPHPPDHQHAAGTGARRLAAWLITRQIVLPLRATLADVERIASGDLSPTAQVHRRDELGALQRGIQQMGSTLRELIGGIRDGVSQISAAAEELSAVTQQTSAGVNSQKEETDRLPPPCTRCRPPSVRSHATPSRPPGRHRSG